MPLTLLLDLDDTLLDANLGSFIPAYFQAFQKHTEGHIPDGKTIPALMAGMSLMNDADNPACTLLEVFESRFYSEVGISKSILADVIENFYDEVFPSLEMHVAQRKDAVPFVEWAFSSGYRIAIATDPLFPRKATYERLRWAGFDPGQFELISTSEHFHFSKTHPAYYAEVLGRLGWPDGPVLMVGNDVNRDLIPAHRLGLKTFFVDGDPTSSPGFEAGRGNLADLQLWLESTDPAMLEPSYRTRDAIMGIMQSTPAVLQSMFLSLPEDQWRHEPAQDEWSINELVCHLRDTEREVHQVQLDQLLEKTDVFIPRPDTGVWASERDYLHEDGPTAVAEFTKARVLNSNKLKGIADDVWARKARHAIFGPTNFMEIMNFVADHDRMHLQQAWKILQGVQAGASN